MFFCDRWMLYVVNHSKTSTFVEHSYSVCMPACGFLNGHKITTMIDIYRQKSASKIKNQLLINMFWIDETCGRCILALSDVCNCTQMILFYEKIINFGLWKFINFSNNVVYHQEIVQAVAILLFFNQDKYDDKKVFGCNSFLIFCIEYFL